MILPHDADNSHKPKDAKAFAVFVLLCVFGIFALLIFG